MQPFADALACPWTLYDPWSDGRVIVRFEAGSHLTEAWTMMFLDWLTEQIEARVAEVIVVDLSEVDYLSSLGLGRLVGVLKTAWKNETSLRFACTQEPIQALLEATRLDRVLDVYPTLRKALEASPSPLLGPPSSPPGS